MLAEQRQTARATSSDQQGLFNREFGTRRRVGHKADRAGASTTLPLPAMCPHSQRESRFLRSISKMLAGRDQVGEDKRSARGHTCVCVAVWRVCGGRGSCSTAASASRIEEHSTEKKTQKPTRQAQNGQTRNFQEKPREGPTLTSAFSFQNNTGPPSNLRVQQREQQYSSGYSSEYSRTKAG